MATSSAIQLREPATPVRVWLQVDPLEHTEESDPNPVRVQLDLTRDEAAFLDALALYWNVLHEVRHGKRRRVLYTRKTAAERLMHAQLAGTREQLRQMFAAVGPFPDLSEGKTEADKAKNHDVMAKYARRVLAWDKKAFGDK